MPALLLLASLALLASSVHGETPPMTPASSDDPYLWLEQTESPRALEWVKAHNERSLAELKGDPRYAIFHAEALKVLEATDRIPMPSLIGSEVYNFWQDATQVRGLWRRATQTDYAKPNPAWETVLDLDALSKAEGANWVWKGANCPAPRFDRCLVNLSDGGEDAVRVREFDPATKAFTPGGFDLPRGKQSADWLDDDTLIVAREWTPGAVTHSGYPYIVKTLKRGQSLDQATEVFRGEAGDVAVDPAVLRDVQGHKVVLIVRATSFFESEITQITDAGARRLHLPLKAKLQGLLGSVLIFTVEQDWKFGGQDYPSGSLVAFTPDELADETRASGAGHLVLAPGARQSIEQVDVTADRIVAVVYDNVRGRVITFEAGAGEWRATPLPVRDDSSVGIATASEIDDTLYYNVEGFLEPTKLWRADAATDTSALVKSLPARFDAADLEVEQHEVASSDGTKIPYFVVHKKGLKLDASNPTLLYAYGGFQVSMLPSYSATIGKLWLERGGVYVLANIRGGGEFGPAWHEAGLKTHRQLIYDDFAAVGEDLIARKITSPRRLGIEGGSNGGLLMGVEFNQHPDLWHAVVIQVPLLDMLRFEQLGAGASWVGEYGSVANPDERKFLSGISPYHNLKAGVAYPEPFFVTSTKDDRVTPVHARKMAAKMEAMGLPFLYFENTDGGHAASANLAQRAERVALEFTYLTRKLMDR
jgi:prolyl oligopeptidase